MRISALAAASVFLFATAPAAADLIGVWELDGNALDSSGNAHHGTVHGATPTTDRFGDAAGAYLFDGANDYIDIGRPIPTDLQPSSGFTLSAWVKASAYSNARRDIVGGIVASQYDPHQTGYSLMIDYRTSAHGGVLGGVHFQVGSPGWWTSSTEGTTDTAIALGEWMHIAAVADAGDTYSVYFDGVRVADWTAGSSIGFSSMNHLVIGWNEHTWGSRRYFAGAIDDVRIYDTALSGDEVYELFATPEPGSLALLLVGLAVIGIGARRRRS